MKITYDLEADAMTIVLRDERIKESDELSPGLIVDYGFDNVVVRIEITEAALRIHTLPEMVNRVNQILGESEQLTPSQILRELSENSSWIETGKKPLLDCPTCGHEVMRWVREDCELEDGVVVPDLEYLTCDECGEKCYDIAAMKKIEAVRFEKRGGNKATIRQTQEKNNA